MQTLLITGGAGFIGSNFIHYIMAHTNYNIINLDKLTYDGNLNNIKSIFHHPRHIFIGNTEKTNLQVVQGICDLLDKNAASSEGGQLS